MGGATALVEPKVFHPGVFARLLKRHRAVTSAYRAAEGLRPVVDIAQVPKRQAGIATADVAPDPQRAEGLAECAKAVGHAGTGSTMSRG